jgi:hypothetical protein
LHGWADFDHRIKSGHPGPSISAWAIAMTLQSGGARRTGVLARIFHTRLDPMHFTESTEPSPQKSQSGQGVWLRDLGSGLCALWEKDFLQKSVIDAG